MYDFIHNAVVTSVSKIAFAIITPFIAYYFFLNKVLVKLFLQSYPASFIRCIIDVFNWILVTGYIISIIGLICNINVFLSASAEDRMDFIEDGVSALSALIALYVGIKNRQRFNV